MTTAKRAWYRISEGIRIRCILFGRDRGIGEGSRVVRTKRRAGIPVGEAFLGRVVNALGEPMDGQGAIEAADFYPMEREAPSIADRSPVTRPMETGILSIDSMFPIGRGQRELIIGDRQTGKTSIALDTMLNQKGQGRDLHLCGHRPEGLHGGQRGHRP